jgi:hypothetical protein
VRACLLPIPRSAERRARTLLLVAALLAAQAGCARLGGLRPRYGPLPGSITLELEAQPDVVIETAAREVVAAGLKVARSDPPEGYLETAWYDVRRRRTVSAAARDLDRVVKLRFFADPTAGHSRLSAECVRRIAYDPSEPERDLERMVPESGPGRALLDTVVARLRVAYPLPETKGNTSVGP